MTYAVTAAREFFGGTEHLPSFTVEALNEDEAKEKARDIIGEGCFEPSLSVVPL